MLGFKEKIADSGKIERYKDITKKYVSEAHLILYALNPSNPIKESRKDDLNWMKKITTKDLKSKKKTFKTD
ncbi:hypothetical protein HpBT171_06640 [Helicobacter pylori]